MHAHILYLGNDLDYQHQVVHFFTDRLDHVSFVMPDSNLKVHIPPEDFLILLDPGGIDPTLLYPAYDLPPDIPTPHPWWTHFRLNLLDYYLKKQQCKIIAEGYAALTVWHALGNKLCDGKGDIVPFFKNNLPTNTSVSVEADNFSFDIAGRILGKKRFSLTSSFYFELCKFIDPPSNLRTASPLSTVPVSPLSTVPVSAVTRNLNSI